MKVSEYMIRKCKSKDKDGQFDWKMWREIFKKEYADIDKKFIDKEDIKVLLDNLNYNNIVEWKKMFLDGL